MSLNLHKLDNPAWHSLTETHQQFAVDYNNLKCFEPEVCPFGGFTGNNNIAAEIDRYAKTINNFFIIGNKPAYSDKIILRNELICLQMVCDNRINSQITEQIVALNGKHDDELVELINFVQPGYFKNRTVELGNYNGIFKDDRLVAVTGERMKMNGLTEVSAVVTHPGHTGKGYAKQLITHTVNYIFDNGDIPFLHVTEKNIGAIRLYENLGFVFRRKISFWNLEMIR